MRDTFKTKAPNPTGSGEDGEDPAMCDLRTSSDVEVPEIGEMRGKDFQETVCNDWRGLIYSQIVSQRNRCVKKVTNFTYQCQATQSTSSGQNP